MIVDVKNCSSCGGNHRVQTGEQVDPLASLKKEPGKEENRFFYCPRSGQKITVKLGPGQKEIDLSKAKDVAA